MSTTPKPSWAAPGLENAKIQHEPILLSVKGQIPSWLAGSLYRTGPGTFRIKPTPTPNDSKSRPEVNMSHWFDGLGMNHCFRITPNGEVYYSNRLSTDGRTAQIQQLGHVPGVTFGKQEDPCGNLFKKFFTSFIPQSNPESGGIPFKDRPDTENISVTLSSNLPGLSLHNATKDPTSGPRYLVAKTDANRLQVLDPDTLEPLELTSYARLDPRLDGQLSAAHSCVDPSTGEFFNYVQEFGLKPKYKVFRATPTEEPGKKVKVDILAEITDAPMAYLHSFVLTKKYVVLCVWQSDYGLNGASIIQTQSIVSSLKKWNPRRDTLFYVISREYGGVVAKFKAPTFFTFHVINAYETPSKEDQSKDDIIIDLSSYNTNAILDLLYLDRMRVVNPTQSIDAPSARRYVLQNVRPPTPPSPASPAPKKLPIQDAELAFSLPNIELPTIHPKLYSSPYRYAYGTHRTEAHAPGVFTDKIIKLDMEAKSWKTWGAEGYTTGEPIFVPRPRGSGEDRPSSIVDAEEDDGVVLSVVLDGMAQRSMLVVLDARDLTEIARAEMDRCFPLGFHGIFSAKL